MMDGAGIGQRVRAERGARGWSMRVLAKKAGVSFGYIAQLEDGKIPSPSLAYLWKIASAMGLTLDDLLGVGTVEDEGVEGDDVQALLTYVRLVGVDDPLGLVRDLSHLPVELQHNVAAIIRALSAQYRGGATRAENGVRGGE